MMQLTENGWIKLHRKMLQNPIVMKDADHLAVWVFLLLHASHTGYPALFKGQKIILKPGQLITGRKYISNELSISESKVFRIINDLKNEHQIEQQASNKNSLITIVNWDLYQDDEHQSEQQLNNSRTTTEQQVNTYKNVKKEKNEKNVKEVSRKTFVRPSFEEVSAYCKERGNNVNPQKFIDWYDANGWMVGKNKMQDWKAAVRTWEQREGFSVKEEASAPAVLPSSIRNPSSIRKVKKTNA